ncbi:MAG: hypothetical protein M3N95_04885 [Actinomycetota bacterium]|nr:hypothetical protein [Actinomycetota bacterium]
MNTFHDFALASGGDADSIATAAMLALGDKLAGRPLRTPQEYRSAARAIIARYGYGLAAATLIAADWLPATDEG